MHIGIFLEESSQGLGPGDAFDEAFQLVDAAEARGLDGVWLGQLHFTPDRSVLTASLVVAGAIAARTRRLVVGTAVEILPLHHPLRIAEEAATVDHISKGRFVFGVGRSGAPRAYDVFGVAYEESQARFTEALALILQAWKGERFSFDGEFYRVRDAAVSPRPYQRPHPPVRVAVTSDETFRTIGREGRPIFVGLRATDLAELRDQLRAYREAWKDAGHPGTGDVYLRIPVYAAETPAAALEEPARSIEHYFKRQAELTRSAVGRAGAGPAERRRFQADRLAALSYDEIVKSKVAFGTAEALVDRLGSLRDDLGLAGIVVELNPGGLIPRERVHRSLGILADEVASRLR